MITGKKYKYNCSDSFAPKKLISYINEYKKKISYDTFLKNIDKVDFEVLAEKLGYVNNRAEGMSIKDDEYIRYYKCKISNIYSYIIEHSSIYYIFY